MAWDSSKGFWANIGGGIADNTVEKIPNWDSSKGFWENTAGGIADNTVEKIPNWDSSKGVTDNIIGGAGDVFNSVSSAVSGVGSVAISGLKKYALPIAAIGAAVLILPRLLKK